MRILKLVIKNLFKVLFSKFFKIINDTRSTQTPITWQIIFIQKFLGFNKSAYWPMHFSSIVSGVQNISIGIDTNPGYMPGCYIQGVGKIEIGDYTQISSNVGMITANHDLSDSRKHIIGEIKIGKYCWIGMNAVILPNVFIGDHVVVGAGSVVTKSFPDGYCVIAGNPAKIIKELPFDSVNKFENDIKYIGYNKITL